ncbi:MAG: hypothetical protein HY556_07900 [Euryarchaeota archaeon]|nr:hypothetical protein [Euryarchaeota archaeon]
MATTGWRVQQTPEFKRQVLGALSKNGDLKDPLRTKMKAVTANPLLGDPKTGALVGFRQIHVHDHWVLTWFLDPTIINSQHLSQLRTITWAKFEKHT